VASSYSIYPGQYGYGYNPNPYYPVYPKYKVTDQAHTDFVELTKVDKKAGAFGQEALSFVKELLPESGSPVGSGNVKTKYGDIPISHQMTLGERYTVIPVIEALLKVLKQDTLNDADVNTALKLARDLAHKLPAAAASF